MTVTKEEIKELRNIILDYDEIAGYWFSGYNARHWDETDDEGNKIDIYAKRDNMRNRALEILKNLEV